jgi:hypothetical protein
MKLKNPTSLQVSPLEQGAFRSVFQIRNRNGRRSVHLALSVNRFFHI